MRGGRILAYGGAICASWCQAANAISLDITDTSQFYYAPPGCHVTNLK
jgi:hypothetical protein